MKDKVNKNLHRKYRINKYSDYQAFIIKTIKARSPFINVLNFNMFLSINIIAER